MGGGINEENRTLIHVM